MALFSERNGRSRSYTNKDLYDAVEAEIQTWEIRQLLFKKLGGEIYFEDKNEQDGTIRFYLEGELENRAAYFRRTLKINLRFKFDDADMFLYNLPTPLDPQYNTGHSLNLFFDVLELIYQLLRLPQYNPKSKRLLGNKKIAQKIFRDAINPDLSLGRIPYTMLASGQIVEISQKPIIELADQVLNLEASKNVDLRTIEPIQNAANHYLARGATINLKKQAVRDLADALESIRPKVKDHLLSEDEKELFRIANQFAIRHNDNKQKSDYDKTIWYDWMFHANLAALLTVIKILKTQESD